MKVLMVVTRLNIGGTETYVASLAKALRDRNVEAGIATVGGPLVATCRSLGIPVHTLPQGSTQTPLAYAMALTNICNFHGYNILHAHDPDSYRAIAPLLQIHRLPVIVTVHGTYFSRQLIRIVGQNARLMIAVSPKLSQWIQSCGVPANKIKVIANGIDTVRFAPALRTASARKALNLPQQGKIIAYAGRFSADKQRIAAKIIQAAERVARLNPHVTTVLAGPGVYRTSLSRLARQANRRLGRQAIRVRPPILQIRTLYQAADLVIGTGRVALEAMACGKPVIATGVKGYFGLITPARIETAIANHFGDHAASAPLRINTLTSDIRLLLKKRELAQSLSAFGRQLILQRFSIDNIAAKIIAAYQSSFATVVNLRPLYMAPGHTSVERRPKSGHDNFGNFDNFISNQEAF